MPRHSWTRASLMALTILGASAAPAEATLIPAVDHMDRSIQASVGYIFLGGSLSTDVAIRDGLSFGAATHRIPIRDSFHAFRLTQVLWNQPRGMALGCTLSYIEAQEGGGRGHWFNTNKVQTALNVALPVWGDGFRRCVVRLTFGPVFTVIERETTQTGNGWTDDGLERLPDTINTTVQAPREPVNWNLNAEVAIQMDEHFEWVFGGLNLVAARVKW